MTSTSSFFIFYPSKIIKINEICPVAPQIVAFSFGDRPANSGESMSATCSVSAGDYPLDFNWFFNGEKILDSESREITISTNKRRSWLEIDAVRAHHAGSYTCSVSNEAGATSHSTPLIVNGNSETKNIFFYFTILKVQKLSKITSF